MLELLPESTGACLGFKMSGKVTEKERHAMLPKLDEAIAAHGKINLLYLMVDFEGWEGFDTGDPDFRLGTEQYHHVEKAAFVGEEKWQEQFVRIVAPLTWLTEERYFGHAQLEEAWAWLKEVREAGS